MKKPKRKVVKSIEDLKARAKEEEAKNVTGFASEFNRPKKVKKDRYTVKEMNKMNEKKMADEKRKMLQKAKLKQYKSGAAKPAMLDPLDLGAGGLAKAALKKGGKLAAKLGMKKASSKAPIAAAAVKKASKKKAKGYSYWKEGTRWGIKNDIDNIRAQKLKIKEFDGKIPFKVDKAKESIKRSRKRLKEEIPKRNEAPFHVVPVKQKLNKVSRNIILALRARKKDLEKLKPGTLKHKQISMRIEKLTKELKDSRGPKGLENIKEGITSRPINSKIDRPVKNKAEKVAANRKANRKKSNKITPSTRITEKDLAGANPMAIMGKVNTKNQKAIKSIEDLKKAAKDKKGN